MNISTRTRYILIGFGAVILAVVSWYFKTIVAYLIIAAVLATLGRPLNRLIRKIKIWKIRLNASLSALLTLLVMLIVIVLFFSFMIPVLAKEFSNLASVDYNALLLQLDEPVSKLTGVLLGEPFSLKNISIQEVASSKVASFFKISQITDVFSTIAGAIGEMMVGVFSVFFITFFFLKEENMFRNGLMTLTPIGSEDRFSRSFDRITHLLNRYFIGLVLEVILVAILVTVGLLIVGLDSGAAILIGLLCGLFNIIPYLGPWIGGSIGIVYSECTF